jgi:hypothetical protein
VARQPLLHGPGHYDRAFAHEYLNKHSLVVSAGPGGPRFRIYGDHTLLASQEGALRTARS